MVQKIEWTEQSRNDLFRIKEYLASDLLLQAQKLKNGFLLINSLEFIGYSELSKPPKPPKHKHLRAFRQN